MVKIMISLRGGVGAYRNQSHKTMIKIVKSQYNEKNKIKVTKQ